MVTKKLLVLWGFYSFIIATPPPNPLPSIAKEGEQKKDAN